MQPATDDEVMALVAGLDPTSGAFDVTAVDRVLGVIRRRRRAGVTLRLTEREWAVLEAAAAGEPVPPHPYREQWDLAVILARKPSTCPLCSRDVELDTEIAQWPLTHQWGHRQCVEDLAAAQPPTRERIRRMFAIAGAMSRRSRSELPGGGDGAEPGPRPPDGRQR